MNDLRAVFYHEDNKNTLCRVLRGDQVVSEGKAGLYVKDPAFIRKVGCKIAFKKAVSNLPSKEERSFLWNSHPWYKKPLFYKVNGKVFQV